jgi:hypothetical protein
MPEPSGVFNMFKGKEDGSIFSGTRNDNAGQK